MSRGNLNQQIYDLQELIKEYNHRMSNRNIGAREYNKLLRDKEQAIFDLQMKLNLHGSY
jgi:hypothetical protein